MIRRLLFLGVVASSILCVPLVSAGVVDLRFFPDNISQQNWGPLGPAIYSQSVIASGNIFSEFAVSAGGLGGTVNFNVVISGARADGGGGLGFAPNFNDVRYTSATFQSGVDIHPNIGVTPGERLFVSMNAATFPGNSRGAVEATAFDGTEHYPQGEFVYVNVAAPQPNLQIAAINNVPWNHRSPDNQDLAILAVFVPVPEPSTLVLFALGLGGLVAMRLRRRSWAR